MTTCYTLTPSPIGELTLASDGDSLTAVYMEQQRYGPHVSPDWVRRDGIPVLAAAARQFEEYFAGARTQFDLPLRAGGTAFQKLVWRQLGEIPYAVTISYGELARRLGNPNASRAVGLANGHNPISIIVPCHRVIGANGSLTGYGGGIERKKWLLDFERRTAGLVLNLTG